MVHGNSVFLSDTTAWGTFIISYRKVRINGTVVSCKDYNYMITIMDYEYLCITYLQKRDPQGSSRNGKFLLTGPLPLVVIQFLSPLVWMVSRDVHIEIQ